MKRIFVQLMTIQLLCAVIAIVVLWKFSEREITDVMGNGFETHGRTVAESIGKSVELNLANRDITSVQSALDASLKISGVDWAYVTSPDGTVIADTFVPLVPNTLPRSGPFRESEIMPGLGAHEPVVMFSKPVMGGIFGYVHVGINQQQMLKATARIRLILLITVGIVFSVFTGIVAFMTQRIVAPIRSLTIASSAMARDLSGEFQEVPVVSKNEIGILTAAFNRMMKERQEDRKHLEERVLKRTRDLVEANKEL